MAAADSVLTIGVAAANWWHNLDAIDSTLDGVVETVLISQVDFWSRAFSFAKEMEKYGEELMHNVTSQLPTAAAEVARFKEAMQLAVGTTAKLKEDISLVVEAQGVKLEAFSEEFGEQLKILLDQLQTAFPPPDKAPSHADRSARVHKILEEVENVLVRVASKYGIEEAVIRSHFDAIKSHVEVVIVTAGDLIEQHPQIAEAILFSGVAMLIPESWLLRPLLGLFGFGPGGPVKGSIAAWAQKVFYGAVVPKGSWFSHLQRATMMKVPAGIGKKIVGAIGAGLGLSFSFFQWKC